MAGLLFLCCFFFICDVVVVKVINLLFQVWLLVLGLWLPVLVV